MVDVKETTISMVTRSDDITKLLVDISYSEESEFISKLKLQNGKHLMERMIYLCSNKPNKAKSTKEDASKIVAQELHDDWIKKNVYPICAKNITKKF